MSIRIALAGNPNCGKTTLFNALTGANQFVGNWPGVKTTTTTASTTAAKSSGSPKTGVPGAAVPVTALALAGAAAFALRKKNS